MNTIEKVLFICMISIMISFILFTSMAMIWDFNSKEYVTDEKKTCEDKDGDIISGLTCYKKIYCADTLIFLNPKECIQYQKGGNN